MIRLAASAHLIHSFSGSLLNSHLQDVDAIYLDIKTADERSAECKSLWTSNDGLARKQSANNKLHANWSKLVPIDNKKYEFDQK